MVHILLSAFFLLFLLTGCDGASYRVSLLLRDDSPLFTARTERAMA